MATIPSTKVLTNVSKNVLNAIRNESSINYRNYVPYATDNADSIRAIGTILMDSPALMNEFLPALIGRIGRTEIMSRLYRSPLSVLKKGILDYGETVEMIFIEMAKPYAYNPEDAEVTLFKRYPASVKSAFLVLNYRKFYPVTIQEEDLRRAFLSYGALESFIQRVIEQMYTGAYYDEFLTVKYLIARSIMAGYPKIIGTTGDTKETAKKILKASTDFQFFSKDYNAARVQNFSDPSNQYIIVSSEYSADLNVDVLAFAFNMDKTEIPAKKIVIDGFNALDKERLSKLFADDPTYVEIGENDLVSLGKVAAVLIDDAFIQDYDNLLTVRDAQNGKGLYTNYFLHIWKTVGISPFSNAAAIVEGTPAVTGITLSPSTATLGKGGESVLTVNVKTEFFAPQTVNFTSNNNDVTVSASGIVKVANTASAGTATITATSVFDSTKKATCVITIK